MMAGIYIPVAHRCSWSTLLANSTKWQPGSSVWALIRAWQKAQGFPPPVAQMLARSGNTRLSDLEMLLGIPEYLAPMKGHARLCPMDLFVLARSRTGLCGIAVEGNVLESFGPNVSEWLEGADPGKEQRLKVLCEHLELSDQVRIRGIRYRLLHRTVAAMLEAQRYHAKDAIVLVHSFGPDDEGFEDYTAFLATLDLTAVKGSLQAVGERNGVLLWMGWVEE